MIRFAAALAALAAACCAPAESRRPGIAQHTGCGLTVSFGSYAMGIDGAAYAEVRRLLTDGAVRSIEERRWGREGEVDLCVKTRSARDATRLFKAIRASLPERPRGPVSLRSAAGLRFDARPPRR